jgi:hypothetical protein
VHCGVTCAHYHSLLPVICASNELLVDTATVLPHDELMVKDAFLEQELFVGNATDCVWLISESLSLSH